MTKILIVAIFKNNIIYCILNINSVNIKNKICYYKRKKNVKSNVQLYFRS